MTEITTEAGKRLLARMSLDVPWFIAGSKEIEEAMIAAIETEAYAEGALSTVEGEAERLQAALDYQRARLAEAVMREVTHEAVLDRLNRVGRAHTVKETVKATVDAVLALLELTDE